MTTIHDWLKTSTEQLEAVGISTARLDCLVLLEDCSGNDRAWLLANSEVSLASLLDNAELTKLTKLLRKRSMHEPLAYIRGHVEFYGREFVVTSDVMVPRPESEAMIDLLKDIVKSSQEDSPETSNNPNWAHHPKIADVGAGSGALGITAKLEFAKAEIDLYELSDEAVQVAETNVDLLTSGIKVIKSDLLSAATTNYDILLCNLPYVPESYQINRAASHEPRIALFGGLDGLDLYRQLFNQVKMVVKHPLYILLETFPSQHESVNHIALAVGYKRVTTSGFIQVFKLTN